MTSAVDRFARLLVGPVVLLAGLLAAERSASRVSAADAVSIQQLMTDKKNGLWPQYARDKTRMTIEGRYSAFSTRLLRFLRCEDLNFVWHDPEQPLPYDSSSFPTRTIEVFGHFQMQGGKPEFAVQQIRALPSDLERLQSRRILLLDEPPSQWYSVGGWAQQRGLFYNDVALQQAAREIYAEGIRRERLLLPDDAVAAKIALAARFAKYGLSEEDRVNFLHETFCRRWLGLRDPKASELQGLTDLMDANLPDCRTAPASQDESLRKRYFRDPLNVYRSASAVDRPRLNRALYSRIRMEFLQAWAKEQHHDEMQLAERIERELPEFRADAERLREQHFQKRLSEVKTLSRDEMLSLAEQFTRRGEPEKALRAKRDWVTAKRDRLRDGGPDDLVQVAHEYQSILKDNDSAAALLIDAYEKAPGLKAIAEQLKDLGWTRVDGKWITKAQAAALPPDASAQAAEAGRYIGMSRDQVRKAVGNPDSVTRVISAGRVNEVWIYNANQKSRLAIHFLGSTDGRDVKVVRLLE